MTSFRKSVTGVRLETTERELSSKTVAYKNGGSTTVRTIETRTRVMIDLSCGHVREQHNGAADRTKAQQLTCWECERIARETVGASGYSSASPSGKTA